MLYWAQNNEALASGAPLWAIVPGACIGLLGGAFAFLNYAFDEIANPALREQRKKRGVTPATSLLEITGLNVDYGEGSEPAARSTTSASACEAGEFLAIVGESGCGKSTLLLRDRPAPARERARSSVAA